MTAICKACGKQHEDAFAAYCKKCRGPILAKFMHAHQVRDLRGDPDRPIRRVAMVGR